MPKGVQFDQMLAIIAFLVILFIILVFVGLYNVDLFKLVKT